MQKIIVPQCKPAPETINNKG